jgi:hypothetical protein
MLGLCGNPKARNLFEIVESLQESEGLQFEVRPRSATALTGVEPHPMTSPTAEANGYEGRSRKALVARGLCNRSRLRARLRNTTLIVAESSQ